MGGEKLKGRLLSKYRGCFNKIVYGLPSGGLVDALSFFRFIRRTWCRNNRKDSSRWERVEKWASRETLSLGCRERGGGLGRGLL